MRLALCSKVAVVLCALLALPAPGTAQDEAGSLVREIEVPLRDGEVSCLELGRALLDAYGFDGSSLEFEDRRISLKGLRGALLMKATEKLTLDAVDLRRSRDGAHLILAIDRERARKMRRGARTRIVALIGRLAGRDLAAREFALVLPDGVPRGDPLVVLVHGVESSPGTFADLRVYLDAHAAGFDVATFAYPNDEAAEEIAAVLAAKLRELDREIALVGHSLGGLIARAVVEDQAIDPHNVVSITLIGTPNAGSKLAGMRFALEAAKVLRADGGHDEYARKLLEGWLASLRDGLGQAGGDLYPGSVFLTHLNRRGRNPDVVYHSVLGTRSLMSRARLSAISRAVERRLERVRHGEIYADKIGRWLADLDELVDGRGDGVVCVDRGRLDGVEPFLVPLDHLALVKRRGILSHPADPHPVFERIVAWLLEDRARIR